MNEPATNPTRTQENPIKRIFTDAAGRYELLNHLMTFWLDTPWRNRAARIAARGGGSRWLDVCCGTGDMIITLRHLAPDAQLVGLDFTPAMLAGARQRQGSLEMSFVQADAAAMPFPEASFDLLTLSFGGRNLQSGPGLPRVFREFHRVLKPGGRLVSLETSQPRASWFRFLVHLYVNMTVPVWGRVIAGKPHPYNYLARSITHFYSAEQLADLLKEAGFSEVSWELKLNGVVAIHVGVK